jgi:hypothetical protein
VHLERRDGLNNTKALRLLIDARKRARRGGRSVPLLGYPQDLEYQPRQAANCAASSSAACPTLPAITPARNLAPHEDGIFSTSESGDSDSSQDDLVDDDGAEDPHGKEKLAKYMAGRAAAAAKKAKAAAHSAMTCGKNTGKALKNALARRLGKGVDQGEDQGECEESWERVESLVSIVEDEKGVGEIVGELVRAEIDFSGHHLAARDKSFWPGGGRGSDPYVSILQGMS